MEKIDDLLDRLRDKATAARGQGGQTRILPDRQPVRDFFIADLVDWALKDDWHSMEHPFFSLSKNPDREIRRYDHNGINITVTPSVLGLATIWDKDILIYAVSQLVEAFNQGRPDVGPCVRITYPLVAGPRWKFHWECDLTMSSATLAATTPWRWH